MSQNCVYYLTVMSERRVASRENLKTYSNTDVKILENFFELRVFVNEISNNYFKAVFAYFVSKELTSI